MISRLREWFYREGMLRTVDLPAFTLSVGNVSLGGTGKSPLVMRIAEWAVGQGIRTAVLSRGYKRKSKKLVIVRPHEPLPSAAITGDEPWMIKHRVPGISLLVHSDRGRMAKRHWRELGAPELVILDDGFQHWRLARDRDFVLLDATENLDGASLPLGKRREGPDALRRADLVILSRALAVDESRRQALAERVRALQALKHLPLWKRSSAPQPALIAADYEFAGYTDLSGRESAGPGAERELLLVSGIAKPDRFRQLAQSLGLKVAEEIYFPDHHQLTPADRARVLASLRNLRRGALLVSEKDWARWHESLAGVEGWALRVQFRFLGEGESELGRVLAEIKGELQRCSISG